MTTQVCSIVAGNGESCISCPAVEAVEAVEAQVITQAVHGWNAGAESVTRLEGDCYVQFSQPTCVGAVVGLANTRHGTDPNGVQFGIYVYRNSGAEWWKVVENGVARTAAVLRDPDDDVFRIERRDGFVSYFHNGSLVYRSTIENHLSLIVVACLYSSGDGVD